MFISQTYGMLEIEEVPDMILDYYKNMKKKFADSPFHIVIGTDSQNFSSDTKVVSVIAVTCEGHGGIFFYQIENIPKITDVRKKIYYETNLSLQVADNLLELIENDPMYEELYTECTYSIHIDAGYSHEGKTWSLIPELIGWVKSMGYDAIAKPDSYCASSIADKISK